MKIALVLISDGKSDLLDGETRVFQKEGCLRQSLLLEVLGIGLARPVFYLVAEPIEVIQKGFYGSKQISFPIIKPPLRALRRGGGFLLYD